MTTARPRCGGKPGKPKWLRVQVKPPVGAYVCWQRCPGCDDCATKDEPE